MSPLDLKGTKDDFQSTMVNNTICLLIFVLLELGQVRNEIFTISVTMVKELREVTLSDL